MLLGVTGSGKTFTVANVIAQLNRPTLVLSHNKTLAAQLYGEFRQFFPDNAVEYFVSYYDYYQPEAYIAATNTYIEKDLAINDDLDKLRLRANFGLAWRDGAMSSWSLRCQLHLRYRQSRRVQARTHLYGAWQTAQPRRPAARLLTGNMCATRLNSSTGGSA